MKKKFKILIYSLVASLFIITALFFLISNKCENDFKIYSEKGYCEFNLKTCEGLFGCKEYNNIQVPCGSISTLCGKKILCDCGHLFINEAEKIEKKDLFVVSGEFICLPVKNQDEPHNDLCVYGIKDVNNNYYRLQVADDEMNVLNRLAEGQKIEISGIYTDELSDIYYTLGTITVNSVKYLDALSINKVVNLPDSFKADYISFSNYTSNIIKVADYKMPGFSVTNGEIDCEETDMQASLASSLSNEIITRKKEINGKKYCVMFSVEGAAGSSFTQNAYTTVIDDNVYLILFTARYNNCTNYPEEELLKCHKEREQFNLDALVDREIKKIYEKIIF